MSKIIEKIGKLKAQQSEVCLPPKLGEVESQLSKFSLLVYLNMVNSFISNNWKKVAPRKIGRIVSGK